MTVHIKIRWPCGSESLILNGVTRLPASWPTAAKAQAYIDDCHRLWLPWQSGRDPRTLTFTIEEAATAAGLEGEGQ